MTLGHRDERKRSEYDVSYVFPIRLTACDMIGEELVFRGTSGSECETFLYHVRRKGFSEGKLKDNEWMAGYASSFFKGDALRWHTRLDPEVQFDWSRLQQAMVEKYLAEDESEDVSHPDASECPRLLPAVFYSSRLPAPSFQRLQRPRLTPQRPRSLQNRFFPLPNLCLRPKMSQILRVFRVCLHPKHFLPAPPNQRPRLWVSRHRPQLAISPSRRWLSPQALSPHLRQRALAV